MVLGVCVAERTGEVVPRDDATLSVSVTHTGLQRGRSVLGGLKINAKSQGLSAPPPAKEMGNCANNSLFAHFPKAVIRSHIPIWRSVGSHSPCCAQQQNGFGEVKNVIKGEKGNQLVKKKYLCHFCVWLLNAQTHMECRAKSAVVLIPLPAYSSTEGLCLLTRPDLQSYLTARRCK